MANLIEIYGKAGQGKSVVFADKILKTIDKGRYCIVVTEERRHLIHTLLKTYDNVDALNEYVLSFNQLEPTNFSAKAEDVIRIIEELKSHYIKEENEKIDTIFIDDPMNFSIKSIDKAKFIRYIHDMKQVNNIVITRQKSMAIPPCSAQIYDIAYDCERVNDAIMVNMIPSGQKPYDIDIYPEKETININKFI